MKLALFLPPIPDERWQLARQMGVNSAIVKLAPELTGTLPPWDFEALSFHQNRFREAGLEIVGLEGDPFDVQAIKLGLPGRDEAIANYCEMLRNMGKLGIRLLCYNFMAGIGWHRTDMAIVERGGALVSGFDLKVIEEQPLTEHGEISAEQIWENYQYFIRHVIPVAEEAGVVMGLHPDDPPVTPLRGIGRVFINAAKVRRALALSDSPSHCLTFCFGSYLTMGEDALSLIGEWKDRVAFVHLRDIHGTPEKFQESMLDDGPVGLPTMLKHCRDLGFSGWIRPDHVPTMAGEMNENPGYETKGLIYATGYIKGILQTLDQS
ncbi:MAG: mannonate dehydratase [Gloeobacteraceae cyanobacterium ES-bin-144]|nr:mannonate dehydratase [Verrucomicrobiales bacterium]